MRQDESSSSSLQMETVFDHIGDAIVILDRELNVIKANAAAQQLLGIQRGFSRHSMHRQFELYLPDGSPVPHSEWPATRALRGEVIRSEFTVRRGPGQDCLAMEISTSLVKDDAGATRQIVVSYRDITDIKASNEARARLAAIVESSRDAIIGKDTNGVVQSWNGAAARTFGYTAEEMIGQSILRLVPPNLEAKEKEFLARVRNGEIIENVTTTRRRKDGTMIQVALTISPICDKDGRVVGASKIARDITQVLQTEGQLRQSQKLEAIGELTGGIAHDFNNLLGVILGNLDLLEENLQGDERALKRVHTAQRAALRSASLTKRLLTFSRNEELRPSPIDLHQAIRNVMELAVHALGPEIDMSIRFAEKLPPVVVDAAGFETALLNLVFNARDAMPNGGLLTIGTQLAVVGAKHPIVAAGDVPSGSYARVSVTDTGHGMPRHVIERAFEPFFTTKERNKGTGLGMAIVYGFVRQSGGTARIYSEVDQGTTISLYFPITSDAATPAPALPPVTAEMPRGRTVLVVDDEPDLLELATTYLHDLGFDTLQANDGSEAITLIEEHPEIDLLVTDVIMPGIMNGYQLAQSARAMRPALAVIFSSGFPANALREKGEPLPGALLIHKPYQRAELVSIVQQVMG
jgi:PAS domain S-box-containing protein